MSRNLDRALETIDEVLAHEGQSSPEASYGADRAGSCWRCLTRPGEGDTELCAPCAAYLKGDTDEDPTEAPPDSFRSYLSDRLEGSFRDALLTGSSYHAIVDEAGEIATPRGVNVTDIVARWGTPPAGRAGFLTRDEVRAAYELPPLAAVGPLFTPQTIDAATDHEQAIATIARVFEVDRDALESLVDGIRRIGVAAEEAMAAIRHVFETTADAIRDAFDTFAEDLEESAADRARALNREAIARYRRDSRRTLGPDLRATEAPRRAPHPNPRRRR